MRKQFGILVYIVCLFGSVVHAANELKCISGNQKSTFEQFQGKLIKIDNEWKIKTPHPILITNDEDSKNSKCLQEFPVKTKQPIDASLENKLVSFGYDTPYINWTTGNPVLESKAIKATDVLSLRFYGKLCTNERNEDIVSSLSFLEVPKGAEFIKVLCNVVNSNYDLNTDINYPLIEKSSDGKKIEYKKSNNLKSILKRKIQRINDEFDFSFIIRFGKDNQVTILTNAESDVPPTELTFQYSQLTGSSWRLLAIENSSYE